MFFGRKVYINHENFVESKLQSRSTGFVHLHSLEILIDRPIEVF